MFICEHWLTVGEIASYKLLWDDQGYWSDLKSSIDPEQLSNGRPHGGIGFIAKPLNGITLKSLSVESDRISGLQLIAHGKILVTILGVYLPFFSGQAEQIQHFSETVDLLAATLETASEGPVLIVGDMNAALPRDDNLRRFWYRQRPYNANSMLLRDFICDNNLTVANFKFDQPVQHTYTNDTRQTYIDHVLVSDYFSNRITNCHIMADVKDNVSDHLPIKTGLTLHIPCDDNTPTKHHDLHVPYPRVNWSNVDARSSYEKHLSSRLDDLNHHIPNLISIENADKALSTVNLINESLTGAMHDASSDVLAAQSGGNKGRVKKHWWSSDCTAARDRQRFWFALWKTCDRPRSGHVFASYKLAKKSYRDARRGAANTSINGNYKAYACLLAGKNLRKFWTAVRTTRKKNTSRDEDVSLSQLMSYFEEKFRCPRDEATAVSKSRDRVLSKLQELSGVKMSGISIGMTSVRKYISKLKLGCCPGIDGVTSEHLKYAPEKTVCTIISKLLTICMRFGVIPDAFRRGLLLPILKKTNIDPSVPANYRPITISSTMAKIMEMYILDESGDHTFSDVQFGFIAGRGTDSAVALAHDVIQYCVKQGSAVFSCSLDAQGAFDEIPHPILFDKCIGVLPDHCWRTLVCWYMDLSVRVKWGGEISHEIAISKGTRQGGLSSPFLFNVFYQGLIDRLTDSVGGIKIGDTNYNTFCYADDILLVSLTATGLQHLINVANEFIVSHGLTFNPAKTECCTFGVKTLNPQPSWNIQDARLVNVDKINYLGVTLANSSTNHIENRISSCRQAFYSLQGAGLCNRSHPDVTQYLWKAAVGPVLTYGLQSIDVSLKNLSLLDKTQSRLLKTAIGVSKFCRSTPLLNALSVQSVGVTRDLQQLKLLHSIVRDNSKGKHFYYHVMNLRCAGKLQNHSDLVGRVQDVCARNDFKFVKTLMDEKYASDCYRQLKSFPRDDGLIDSVKQQLWHHNCEYLNLLLIPF